MQSADMLDKHRGSIKEIISYLNKNREALDEATLGELNRQMILDAAGHEIDPIQKLQHLSRKELAFAYDSLILGLTQREALVERRIKDQIDHLGKEERIFFEHKDWSKELEDMKPVDDPFNQGLKAEEILSVTEQVNNVLEFKNVSP